MWASPVQTSLEQGVDLRDVTFAVVDLETTGGSPAEAAITEIGAVKVRGGERLGTFQTLVDPRQPIPPFVAHLTGIDDRMVCGAPPIEAVLPSLLEFLRGTVFVAHNATFDFSFLNVSLDRLDHPPLPGPIVCTAKLARRVVWPDVPNVRLATLARHFRTRTQPSHRALADADATAEVLDGLLDMAARLGISTLGELFQACSARGRPNFGKILLAEHLPSAPGVYAFHARDGRILYVGKSKDVKGRVKSYFYGDGRKKVQDLLDEVVSVEGLRTPGGEVEALVLEARLIGHHEPPYNRHGKRWRSYAYLKIDPAEAWPRLKTAREARAGDGCTYLGPFSSAGRARLAKEALEEAFDLRRCTRSMGRRTRFAPCALADMGRCQAPCDDRTSPERYTARVQEMIDAQAAPGALLATLEGRMQTLADARRYEEASLARDRIRVLVDALWRARVDRWLCAGHLVLRGPGGERIELIGGSLVVEHTEAGPIGTPPARDRADELAALRSWIVRNHVTVLGADSAPSEPVDGGRAIAALRGRLAEARLPPVGRSRSTAAA